VAVDRTALDEATISACCAEIAERFSPRQKINSLRVQACPALVGVAKRLFGSTSESERDLNDLVHFAAMFTEPTLSEAKERALLRAGEAFLFCSRVPNDHDFFLIQRGNPGPRIASRDTKKVRDTWAFMTYKRSLLGNPEDSFTAKSGQKMRPDFRDATIAAVAKSLRNWDEFQQTAAGFRAEQLASRLMTRPYDKTSPQVDTCEFITETVPDGSLMPFGTAFVKTWTIRNTGNVPWIGRSSKRITPLTPLFPHTAELTPIPTTLPGETVTISVDVVSNRLPGFSEVRFKMVDENGEFCWPVLYPYGLTMVIETRDMIWTERSPGAEDTPWQS